MLSRMTQPEREMVRRQVLRNALPLYIGAGALVLANILYVIYEGIPGGDILMVDVILLILGLGGYFYINRELLWDYRRGMKDICRLTLDNKEWETFYASDNAPVLFLFIDGLFRRNKPRKGTRRYYFISGGRRYTVEEEIFDKFALGDTFEAHISEQGGKLLGVYLPKD